MSDNEGQRLLGEGRPIKLLSGEEVQLRFTNRSMLKIEELFGSYGAFQEQMAGGTGGPLFHAINKGAFCALQHDEKWRTRFWEFVDSLDPDYVVDEVQGIVLDVLAEAFPPKLDQPTETEPSSPATDTPPSPGPTFTPLLDELLDSAMTSSGT